MAPDAATANDIAASLLAGAGPCPLIDARLHALAAPGSMEPPPPYTSSPDVVREAARAFGMLVASGTRPTAGWAAIWLPPPLGDAPFLAWAPDEARALALAFAEALAAAHGGPGAS